MAETTVIPFKEAVKTAIQREFELAKARFGNDWQLLCIEENWGDTLDDRHTLRMLRSLNRNGSCYAKIFFAGETSVCSAPMKSDGQCSARVRTH